MDNEEQFEQAATERLEEEVAKAEDDETGENEDWQLYECSATAD